MCLWQRLLYIYKIASFIEASIVQPLETIVSKVLHFSYYDVPMATLFRFLLPTHKILFVPVTNLLKYLIRFYYARLLFAIISEVASPSTKALLHTTRFYTKVGIATSEWSIPFLNRVARFYCKEVPCGVLYSVVPVTKSFLIAVSLLVKHILVPALQAMKKASLTSVFKFYSSSLPNAIYSSYILPAVNIARHVPNFYFQKLPKAVSHEILPVFRRDIGIAGKFYLRDLPVSVYKEIVLPSVPVAQKATKFWIDVPQQALLEFRPYAQLTSTHLVKYYLAELPKSLISEVGPPFGNVASFYVSLLMEASLPLPYITRFYFDLLCEVANVVVWIGRTLKLSSLWMYGTILSPAGWRVIAAARWCGSLFYPLVNLFKQFMGSISVSLWALKSMVSQMAKSVGDGMKDMANGVKDILVSLFKAILDLYRGLKQP
eukprot:TRINITY_DN2510_c0_g1_i5.p1 TRINITY_DN2510_c0_g1~~TRINITY_DN2510_c0_g1_i5.p1  ORF type:complete len:431 (-),score=11.08 TRINITY_DN2510_c0_g1_i5:3-1295(-)